MRPVQRRERRHVGSVERAGPPGGGGHAQRLRDGVGRGGQQAGQQAAGPHGPGRCACVERRRAQLRQQGPTDPAEGHKDAS